jgi:hypothetical protein
LALGLSESHFEQEVVEEYYRSLIHGSLLQLSCSVADLDQLSLNFQSLSYSPLKYRMTTSIAVLSETVYSSFSAALFDLNGNQGVANLQREANTEQRH